MFKKCTYGSEALFDYLRKCDYKEIELCGLVSNICVISNAVLARPAVPNARLTVDSNATASNDNGLNTALSLIHICLYQLTAHIFKTAVY